MMIEKIIKSIIDYYGESTDRGCYINGKWLSIEQIIKIIESQEEN